MRFLPVALLAMSLCLSACGLADIKPAAVDVPVSATAAKKGKALLHNTALRYGLTQWQSFEATTLELTDTWPGFLVRTFAMPWQKNGQAMRFEIANGQDQIRARFLDGTAKGHEWGIQNWATYTKSPGGPLKFKPDSDITFWLPTITYFVELPFRILEANVVAYAGQGRFRKETYDRVFATWNTARPQRNVDQYVVWINRRTGQIDYVEYTIRDFGKTMKGAVYYRDLRQVQGVTVAFDMLAGGEPGTDKVGAHRMQITRISFHKKGNTKRLLPNPGMRRSKY